MKNNKNSVFMKYYDKNKHLCDVVLCEVFNTYSEARKYVLEQDGAWQKEADEYGFKNSYVEVVIQTPTKIEVIATFQTHKDNFGKYHLTIDEKNELIKINFNSSNVQDILDFFVSIRPKSYQRLFKQVAKKHGVNNERDMDKAHIDGTYDEIALELKHEILFGCGIE